LIGSWRLPNTEISLHHKKPLSALNNPIFLPQAYGSVSSKNEYMLLTALVLPLRNHKLATIRQSATNAIKDDAISSRLFYNCIPA